MTFYISTLLFMVIWSIGPVKKWMWFFIAVVVVCCWGTNPGLSPAFSMVLNTVGKAAGLDFC